MSETQLNRRVYWADRWPVLSYSPRSLEHISTPDKKVIVHAGWGKSPKRLAALMVKLADAGTFPIGIDTRWAYANQGGVTDRPRISHFLAAKSFSVGETNRYAGAVGIEANRYSWRRPTAVLALGEALELESTTFVGHSEAGRIGTLAAQKRPKMFNQLVLVNPVGTAHSPSPVINMIESNYQRAKEAWHNSEARGNIVMGAVDATAYTVTHPRRFMNEKAVILDTDIWLGLETVHAISPETQIDVFSAINDQFYSHQQAALQAAEYDCVNFTPIEGEHYNIYYANVQDEIVKAVAARP